MNPVWVTKQMMHSFYLPLSISAPLRIQVKLHGTERSRTSWKSNSAPPAQTTGPRTNQLSAEFFIATILMGTFLSNLSTVLFSTTPPFYFVPLRQGWFHLVKFPSVLGNVSLKKSNWFIMAVCTWFIFSFLQFVFVVVGVQFSEFPLFCAFLFLVFARYVFCLSSLYVPYFI